MSPKPSTSPPRSSSRWPPVFLLRARSYCTRTYAAWTRVPLPIRVRYAVTCLALVVIARMCAVYGGGPPNLRHAVAKSALFARYVDGKRCEAISHIHVEGEFYNPERCFSRSDIQQILVGLVWAIHDTFERHGLPYWIDSGTLLGAYRDKTVIPHDTDADIGVDAATFTRLRDGQWEFPSVYELQVFEGKFHKTGSRDSGIPGRLIHTHSGFYVDIFVFHDAPELSANRTTKKKKDEPNPAFFGPEPSMCFSGCWRCPKIGERQFEFKIPKSWVFPLQQCWFGGRVVSCPAESEKYLDYLYGPEFRTPDQ